MEESMINKHNGNTSMHSSVKTRETLPSEYDMKTEANELKANNLQKKSLYAKFCSCLNILQLKKPTFQNAIISEFTEGITAERQAVYIPPKDQDLQGKKTLVLDLDETLITSSILEFKSADLKIKINLPNGGGKNVWVKFRPGVQNFLTEMNEFYELIIFTSSIKEYANAVIDYLDCESLVSLRIFRENCSTDMNGNLYKDLNKLNRPIQEIIIIDNQASQFRKNLENGIQIKDFKIDNKEDYELYNLIPFLKFMSGVKDVRDIKGYMNDFYSGNQINYIDINGMECQFQRGVAVEESRLQTEKTESKIDPIDLQFNEDNDSSNLGQTIKLDSRDYKKQEDHTMMNHFEDDIDAAIKIQENINRQNRNNSNHEIAYPKNSPKKSQKKDKEELSDKKQKESLSEKKQIFKNAHKAAAKTVFDFNSFKQSLYNKFGSSNDSEKENIQLNINLKNDLIPSLNPIYSTLQDTSEEQSVHCINKSEIDANQTSADHSENFIQRPKRIIRPHNRRCASQAIKFVEVSMKEENFNSPNNVKEC